MIVEASVARRRYVLLVLTVIYVFNTMDRYILAILAEPIRHDLRITDTQFGLLTGLAFAVFYTTFGVPAGWLADRVGRIRVIAAACTLWSLCSAAGSLAGNFATLALSRMGVGIGDAGGGAPSYSLISDYFPPEQRSRVLGVFHSGSAAALLIGGIVGGWIATGWGWRWALALVSLPGLAFALLLYLTVPETPHESQAASSRPIGAVVRAFFADPLMRGAALASGLTSLCTFGMLSWAPTFLMRVKGMSLGEVAAWYGPASAIGNGLGLACGGWLAGVLGRRDRRAYAWVPLGACLVLACLVMLAVRAPGWPLTLACLMLSIMAAQMFVAPLVTIIQNGSPTADRSLYSALYLLISNTLGMGCGPVYVGMLSDALAARGAADPLAGAFAGLIPAALVAATVHWRLARQLGRAARRELQAA